MNKDYENQESTEEKTESILKSSRKLKQLLKEDNITIEEITDFKKYPIVDNHRPKVCADRIDGVILTGIGWTKNITKNDITNIIQDLTIFKNEDDIDEISFQTKEIAQKVLEISESIDIYCHSNEDNYMMMLLAKIAKLSIEKKYITYKDLFKYNEEDLFKILKRKRCKELKDLITEFETKKLADIPHTIIENIKIRDLNPLVNGKRLKN